MCYSRESYIFMRFAFLNEMQATYNFVLMSFRYLLEYILPCPPYWAAVFLSSFIMNRQRESVTSDIEQSSLQVIRKPVLFLRQK